MTERNCTCRKIRPRSRTFRDCQPLGYRPRRPLVSIAPFRDKHLPPYNCCMSLPCFADTPPVTPERPYRQLLRFRVSQVPGMSHLARTLGLWLYWLSQNDSPEPSHRWNMPTMRRRRVLAAFHNHHRDISRNERCNSHAIKGRTSLVRQCAVTRLCQPDGIERKIHVRERWRYGWCRVGR